MADYKKKLKDAQGGVLPVTTADQVIVNEEDGSRLNSVLITAKFDPVESELSMPVNADTLAGEPASRYLKGKFYDSDPVDAVPVNADMLGGQPANKYITFDDLKWGEWVTVNNLLRYRENAIQVEINVHFEGYTIPAWTNRAVIGSVPFTFPESNGDNRCMMPMNYSHAIIRGAFTCYPDGSVGYWTWEDATNFAQLTSRWIIEKY